MMKKNITDKEKYSDNASIVHNNSHIHNEHVLSDNETDDGKNDHIVDDLYDKVNNIHKKNKKKKSKNVSFNESGFISSIEYRNLINDFNKIELLKCVGDDLTIINSCNLYESITLEHNDQFKKILTYLMNNNIDSFRQPHIQFKFNMPIYIKNKWTDLSSNIKRCYSIIGDDYTPNIYLPNFLQKSFKLNLNGSLNEPIYNNDICLNLIKKHYNDSIILYNNLLKNNVNIETAMSVLPQSTYINFIETGSLYDYYILYKTHNNNLKQPVIHEYVSAINNILQKKFPETWTILINNY